MIFAVYGTLKQAYGNHRLLASANFLGVFKTPAVYTLLDGGFPVVERINPDKNGNVNGTSIECELYETEDQNVIDRVFSLEGCEREQDSPNSWYTYDLLETPVGEATMFVMNQGASGRTKTIENGVWGRTRTDEVTV